MKKAAGDKIAGGLLNKEIYETNGWNQSAGAESM
jgi:hypothetical protein